MAKLLVTLPNIGDTTYDLAGDVITIGRTPDNKVQVSHESIHPHHAQLIRSNGHFRLKDLGSSGRSFVNGLPVTEAILNGSCILRFGAVECVFKDENTSRSPDQLQSQLAEARRQIESLMRARDALHEQNRELVKQRDRAQESRDDLNEEITEAKSRVEHLKKDLGKAAAEKQTLAAKGDEAGTGLRNEIAVLKKERDEATTQLSTLNSQLSAATQATEKTRSELDGLRQEREALQARLDAAQNERQGLSEQLAAIAREREDANTQLSTLNSQLAAATADRDQAIESHKQLAAGLDAHRVESTNLESRLDDARKQIASLAKERDAAKQGHDELSAQLTAFDQERQAAKQGHDELSAQLAALAQERDAAKRGHDDLSAQLTALAQERDAAKQSHDDLSAQLAQVRLEAISDHDAGTSKLIAEIEKLRRELDATHDEHRMFARRTHELTSELDKLRLDSDAVQRERETADTTRRELEAHLAETTEKLAAAESAGAASVQMLTGQLAEARLQLEPLQVAVEQEREAAAGVRRELEARLAETTEKLAATESERSSSVQTLTDQLAESRTRIEALQDTAQQAEARGAELEKLHGELVAAIEQRDAAEQQHTELLARMVEAQKHTETLNLELESTRRHDDDLVLQLSQVREELAAQPQQREALQRYCDELNEKLGGFQTEAAALRAERDTVARENLVLIGKSETQAEQVLALTRAADSAKHVLAELTAQLQDAQARLGDLSKTTLADQAQITALTEQLESHRSQLKEFTKQRDVLLETNARLAVEVEASRRHTAHTSRNTTPTPAAPPAAAPEAPANQSPDNKSESSIAAPPELASWLKRAFHKRKQPEDAPQPEPPAHRSQPTGPRFPQGSGVNVDDAGAVSLDFLGAPEPGDDEPEPVAPEPACAETLKLEPQTSPEPAVSDPHPELLKPMVPDAIGAMRRTLQYFIRHTKEAGLLEGLSRNAREISAVTATAGYPLLHIATSALDAFITDIQKTPSRVNPSTLRTLGQSLDFVHALLDDANLDRLTIATPMSAIAIEDEPDVLAGIVAALEDVKLKTCATKQAKPALSLLSSQKFDIIFLDVGLPDMSGLDLCTKIRGIAQHRKTPIIFLTGMTTVENRAQSTLKGGNDFIGKPFHLSELSMKASMWVLKGYLGMA